MYVLREERLDLGVAEAVVVMRDRVSKKIVTIEIMFVLLCLLSFFLLTDNS